MQNAYIALNQAIVMFMLAAVGWLLFRTGKITAQGSKEMATMLLYAVMPCTIVNAFRLGYTPERAEHLIWSFGISTLCLILAMAVAHIIFKKRPIDNFGSAFSNAGFMGIPFIQALYGNDAVIFAAPLIALLNILQWTYGGMLFSGKMDGLQPRKLLTNPIVIALFIGMGIFFMGITLPSVVGKTVNFVASMNTPMAMIVLGVYLAQVDLGTLVTDKHLYMNSLVRLVVIPLLTLAMLSLLPAKLELAKMAILIAASAPVGANVAVYAQIYNVDYGYASKTVCMSTLISIVTMPILLLLASR